MEYYFCEQAEKHLQVVLKDEEHMHCAKVMRHRPGDIIYVLDGKGHVYSSKISTILKNETVLQILETIKTEPDEMPKIVAISPTKNPSRLEWFVEKSTEMGVTGILIVQCERTEKKFNKPDRLIKIMISAMKQSGRTHLPFLKEVGSIQEIPKYLPKGVLKKYIAHCQQEEKHLGEFADTTSGQVILIGPEGDFTPAEVSWAKSQNILPVSLGKNRLRTETAGLYALFCLLGKG